MAYRVEGMTSDFNHHYEHNQDGHFWMYPIAGGFHVKVEFSNGKKFDGDHYSCDIIPRRNDDSPVLGIQFKAGLNPAGSGGAKKRIFEKDVLLSDEQISSIHYTEVEFGKFDESNDSEIWKAIGEAVKKVFGEYNKEPTT